MIKILPIKKTKGKPYYYLEAEISINHDESVFTREIFPQEFFTEDDAVKILNTWNRWVAEDKIGCYGLSLDNVYDLRIYLNYLEGKPDDIDMSDEEYMKDWNEHEVNQWRWSKREYDSMAEYHHFTKEDIFTFFDMCHKAQDLLWPPVEYTSCSLMRITMKYKDENGDIHDCEVSED